MVTALSPLAQYILEAADAACGRFETEAEFFDTFGEKVLGVAPERQAGIAMAIAEVVHAGRWPWKVT
jgi:hypothetical protein